MGLVDKCLVLKKLTVRRGLFIDNDTDNNKNNRMGRDGGLKVNLVG
jgi:hypothetical protein